MTRPSDELGPIEPVAGLAELCDAAVENRLTDEQRTALEKAVLKDGDARRFYIEYLHQHAALQWSAADPAFLGTAVGNASEKQTRNASFRIRWWTVGAAAAGLAICAGIILSRGAEPAEAVATLVDAKSCKWDATALSTEVGARLGAGRLKLADGLARIVFDSGAEVTIEAPADLELVTPSRCVLRSGRLVAKVPPPAIGFTVDTPTAVLVDQGTEFGVNVADGRAADVQVFEGLVDARHLRTGKTERMRTGRNLRFGADDVAEFDPHSEPAAITAPDAVGRAVQITTAMGRGKDTYVQPIIEKTHRSDVLLLVKSTVPELSNYNRKAYMGFDLAAVAGMKVTDARLTLAFTPTGMGFASQVPDAVFTLYGLTDESLDGWVEQGLTWSAAPANRPGGSALDADKVVKLGTFTIGQGELRGTRTVSGEALADFLNRDTNGLATFILVRETRGSGRNDLVHGFAGNNHPALPPPTLKLTVVPKAG